MGASRREFAIRGEATMKLVDELRAAAKDAIDWNGKPMTEWDRWRAAIADGERGSWPRDAFEGWLDHYADLMTRAADALEIAK